MNWCPLTAEIQEAIEQAIHWARFHGCDAQARYFEKWVRDGGYWYPAA